ncbi:complement component receptor 1-like protein isoform X2 [Toxotes jaculatrix]|uniref:complement component receptor 1-like protein isoform X2 n=1 Tax=Toxotes jaculatrix TaxID=941984 RepID=UPI001B3A96CC|nr:complement component receptor 1-like protein isoform X2 [Toxotes jaculatrix]
MRNVWRNILVLWFMALPASAQLPKKCSAPLEYPHTALDKKFTGRQTFSSGEKVYYNCAEDFTPSKGSRAVQCLEGKWTKLTLKCEKKSCGNAGDLQNGQFHYEGNSFLGEKVYATCNEGYTLKGPNYMICKKSGWTGEVPTCEGETTCSTPVVANSVKSGGDVSVYWVGDNVTFTCSQGFELDGAPQVTCGPDGQWQPQPPQCLPLPDDKTEQSSNKETGGCIAPPTIKNSNANLADKYITMTSFTSGDRVQYVCDVGYNQVGGSRYRTCKDGKWTPLFLKCEPKLCGSAGEILNGQFTYTGVEFGDTATAVCDEGYVLVGKAIRNCMSNGWDGRVPVCEAVVCAEPSGETNAVMKCLQEPPYTYRSVLRYECHVGTLIGQREIWCTRDGTWSAPLPTCREMTCSSPNVPGASWTRAQNNLYQYSDTISIECNPGYYMTGPSTVTCGHDGRWFPGLPKCRRARRRNYWRN